MPEQTYMISSSGEGDVCVSADVHNRIVSTAVGEVDGVAGLAAGIGPDVAEYLGVKSVPKGVRIEMSDNGLMNVDVVILVRFGYKVAQVAEQVQQHVIASMDAITGIKSVVNVHVTGISFEKAEIK